jgi:hypothetical protein
MKIRPVENYDGCSYPSMNRYNETYRRLAVVVAATAAMGGMAMCSSLSAEEAAKEQPKAEQPTDQASVKKTVLELVAKLGSQDYNERTAATAKLIEIGKTEKTDVNKNKLYPFKEIVLDEMKKITDSKDPEVKERAKLVVRTLETATVKEKPIRIDAPAVGGIMVAPMK